MCLAIIISIKLIQIGEINMSGVLNINMAGVLKWIAQRSSSLTGVSENDLGWGEAVYCGEPIDIYYNINLIRDYFTKPIEGALPKNEKCKIADFGSGDGHVIQTVFSQLARPEGFVCPFGIDFNKENLVIMEQTAPNVKPCLCNLLKLDSHFEQDFFHAGIFRFVLPFIRKDDQQKALDQIYKVLKPGAILVVFNYGGFSEGLVSDAYSRLFAAGSACEQIITHNPSCECVMDMAAKAGFKVDKRKAFDLTDVVVGYISPKIYSDVFKRNHGVELSSDQQRILKVAFEAEKNVLPIEPSSLRVRRPMYTCILEK